jgi:Fe-S cluster biogenesis protein NfuA
VSAPVQLHVTTRAALETALERDVLPGLSAHAGAMRVESLDDELVELHFLGSCTSCYFRVSCAVNLVEPTVREALGTAVELRIPGVSRRQLNR